MKKISEQRKGKTTFITEMCTCGRILTRVKSKYRKMQCSDCAPIAKIYNGKTQNEWRKHHKITIQTLIEWRKIFGDDIFDEDFTYENGKKALLERQKREAEQHYFNSYNNILKQKGCVVIPGGLKEKFNNYDMKKFENCYIIYI